MSIYNITLNDPWFDLVKSGEKKYEGRCYRNNTVNYKIGDTLIINHHINKTRSPYKKIIKNILLFKTFEDALKYLPMKDILPNVNSIEEYVDIYKKYVSIETQEKYGVCMIELQSFFELC